VRTVAEITLAREPDAVPRARRLVRDALGDELPSLAADAELVVSELVTNASLHGEAPITVRVLINHVLRIEVEDSGRSAPILLRQRTDAMTGRGLSMVAAVASNWGVMPLEPAGKVIWAELDPDGGPERVTGSPQIDVEALLEAWADDDPATATYAVRLGPVPTQLLLEAKAHIDNVVRELVLMRGGEASSGVALPDALSALIRTVTVEFAEARTEIKRLAAAAASRGDILTDLELHLSPASAGAGEHYLEALDEADRYARSAHFLTLAPPRVHRVFRQWYVRSLVAQLRAMAAGAEPPDAIPFQVILAREFADLSEAADSADRLAMVHKVSGELARAASTEHMARVVVDRAIELPGVETARVRLLTPDAQLRMVAWRGRPGREDLHPSDFSIDADLPGAAAARAQKPILIRSLAQAFGEFPGLAGRFDPRLSGHILPLVADGRTLGLLSLAFAGGELSEQAEIEFGTSLADVLSQALARAEIDQEAARVVETVRELERAHQNLRFVLDATTRVAASLDSDDTLRTLARIAVPRLADICLIDLLDGNGFRRAATAAGELVAPELAAGLGRYLPDPTSEHPAARAVREGRPVHVENMSADYYRRALRDEEYVRFVSGSGAHSCMALPLAARGRTLGAITLILVAPGRNYSQSDITMVEDLGRRVALAIDTTQLYESSREAERRLALVARAGVTLTSSLDLDTVVARLCDLVLGYVADRCEVYVRRAPGQWWRYSPGSVLDRLVRVDDLPARVADAVETTEIATSGSAGGDLFSPGYGAGNGAVNSVIPLLAHGEVVGVIALASSGVDAPTRVPADTVAVIAGRAALAIDNALLYEQERTAAEILQRSLLPHHLPVTPGLRAAARYLPAGARNEIGGDWYDLFVLGPDRVGLVMGDVMGRGIPAASVMGQLRNGLRMLAVQDVGPADALGLLNLMLGADDESPLATVAYGVLDVARRTLTLANAGHLPPLLVQQSVIFHLDQWPDVPLGAFADTRYSATEYQLHAGDTLVLYTDGLIEQRDRSLDEGMDALVRAAAAARSLPPDPFCDVLLRSLRRESDEDDTAVLALQLDG
jgi:GAF domain-containing protein